MCATPVKEGWSISQSINQSVNRDKRTLSQWRIVATESAWHLPWIVAPNASAVSRLCWRACISLWYSWISKMAIWTSLTSSGRALNTRIFISVAPSHSISEWSTWWNSMAQRSASLSFTRRLSARSWTVDHFCSNSAIWAEVVVSTSPDAIKSRAARRTFAIFTARLAKSFSKPWKINPSKTPSIWRNNDLVLKTNVHLKLIEQYYNNKIQSKHNLNDPNENKWFNHYKETKITQGKNPTQSNWKKFIRMA